MKSFFFTFGQNHTTTDGYPLKDYWVEVKANDVKRARVVFRQEFGHHIPALSQWASVYSEENFKPDYFPKGRYMFIADIHEESREEGLYFGFVDDTYESHLIKVMTYEDGKKFHSILEKRTDVIYVLSVNRFETLSEALSYYNRELPAHIKQFKYIGLWQSNK